MKKSLLVVLAVTLIMSSTTIIYAANPFVDVPANHWAYKSVMELAKAGIVDGMGNGTLQGDKTVSRYEMAQIVAKAMAKVSKADSKCKDAVQKLQAEFATELQSLGVKVDGLKTQVDNMPKISAEVRVRYEDSQDKWDCYPEWNDTTRKKEERSRLNISGNINDSWTYNGRLEDNQAALYPYDNDFTSYNLAWVEGKVMNGTLKLGLFDYVPAYGLTANSQMKGLSFQGKAGNNFDYGVYAGKAAQNYWSTPSFEGNGVVGSDAVNFYGVEAGTKLGADANIKASWLKYRNINADDTDLISSKTYIIREIGVDVKLSDDWKFKAVFAKSNADYDNKSYIAGVNFRGADKTKPGSFGLDLSYQYCQVAGCYDTILDVYPDFKGYKLGVDYTIDKNIVLKGSYIDQKLFDIPDYDLRNKTGRAELFFYF